MDVPFKGPVPDRYFPYIVIHDESAPADIRLEGRSIVRVFLKIIRVCACWCCCCVL